MKKFTVVGIALALGATLGTVAQSAEPWRPWLMKSPQVQPAGPFPGEPWRPWLVKHGGTKEVQSAGAHPNEPGISNDPVSAEKPGKPVGGSVQAAGPHPEEPGISNDPVSAEKSGRATGGPVTVTPGPDANRNPNAPAQQ